MNLVDNKVNCPVCGFEEAKVANGVFNITNDAIEVISAPDITVEMLKAFAGVAQRVSEGAISAKEAITEAEAIAPKLGALLRRGLEDINGLANILVVLIAIYISHFDSASSDVSAGARQQELLSAVTEQTYILKSMQHQKHVTTTGHQHPKLESKTEKPPSAAEALPKSARRSQVNDARREIIKKRRTEFGRSRTK
jgi:hypothetical protein